jgi:hypothetical protein
MSATTVKAYPAEPQRPQGPWVVMVNNRRVSTQFDQTDALHHADSLRELFLGEDDKAAGTAWLPRDIRRVLGVGMVTLLSSIGYCSQARADEDHTVGLRMAAARFGGHDLRADTPGLPARLYARHVGGAAGGYRNSYDRWRCCAGYTWRTLGSAFAPTAGGVAGHPAQRVTRRAMEAPSIFIGTAAPREPLRHEPLKHGAGPGSTSALTTGVPSTDQFPLEARANRNPGVRWPLMLDVVSGLCCFGGVA